MSDLLQKLHDAGVATHGVAVNAPAGVAERALLDALMAAVGGTVFRLAPYSYAVRAADEDPSARIADALAGLVPRESVCVAAARPPDGAAGGAEEPLAEPLDPRALTLIAALAEGAETIASGETPAQRAVLDAGFALAAARLAAEGIGTLSIDDPRAARAETAITAVADRLAAIEEHLGEGLASIMARLEMLEARAAEPVPSPELLDRLSTIAARLSDPGPIEAVGERLSTIETALAGIAASQGGGASADHRESFLRFSVALQAVLRRLDAEADALAAAVRRTGSVSDPLQGEIMSGPALDAAISALSGEIAQAASVIRADNACTRTALAEFMARADRAGLVGDASREAAE